MHSTASIQQQQFTPNRFNGKSYDRSVYGVDDCTKSMKGGSDCCSCYMCCLTPLVIVSSGESICDQYSIRLRNVKEFVDGGLLEPLQEESFMIYMQTSPEKGITQIGVLAALDVEDCKNNIIKRHERTTKDVDVICSEKARNYRSSYVDPIMVMYRGSSKVDDIIQRIISEDEPVELLPGVKKDLEKSQDHYEHYLWTVQLPDDIFALQEAFAAVDSLYIADGHHRTAAACRFNSSPQRFARGKTSPALVNSAKYLTALIFPDSHLTVLSYNRCVSTFAEAMNHESFLHEVAKRFQVTKLDSRPSNRVCSPEMESEIASCRDSDAQNIFMYMQRCWYTLTSLQPVPHCEQDPLGSIDAQILLDRLLQPILHIDSYQTENRMIYVDGREGCEGLERRVDSGEAVVAFSVGRVSVGRIMQIADADQLLPPKATFFDPKPLPGLLLRLQR